MAFTNEYIPQTVLNQLHHDPACIVGDHWSIDRERNVWLRRFSFDFIRNPTGKIAMHSLWQYYWHGHMIRVVTQSINIKLVAKAPEAILYQRLKVIELVLPQLGVETAQQMRDDLTEALRVYAVVGVHAHFAQSLLVLEFQERLHRCAS